MCIASNVVCLMSAIQGGSCSFGLLGGSALLSSIVNPFGELTMLLNIADNQARQTNISACEGGLPHGSQI